MPLPFPRLVGLAVGVLLLGLPQTVQAQLNNQAFAFQQGGPGVANVGMSSAYREIVLERKLLGRSTANNFIRGMDGSLVNVERSGQQAFARPTTSPYAASQNVFALGIGGTAAIGSADRPRGEWRGEQANEDMPAVFGAPAGAVPINSWIYQLSNLPDLAL